MASSEITSTVDLPPTEEERNYLNRSKKKIKSTMMEPIHIEMDEEEEHSILQMGVVGDTPLKGKERSVIDPHFLPSSSNSKWSKSFKEAVTGKTSPAHVLFESEDEKSVEDDNLMDEENKTDEETETEKGEGVKDPLCPEILIPPKLVKSLHRDWKNSLIVKLLGRSNSQELLKQKVQNLWELESEYDIIGLGNNFYLVKFDSLRDAHKVFTECPWIIMNHYLMVRKWTLDFRASKAEETKTAVWVRFPELPVEYYKPKPLFLIAKELGRSLKIDFNTASTIKGRFARVCIEIDLSKPLISHFKLRKQIYTVEYEYISSICFGCGRMRHKVEFCNYRLDENSSEKMNGESTVKNVTILQTGGSNATRDVGQLGGTEDYSPIYGPWMLATRRNRRPASKASRNNKGNGLSSNKFSALAQEEVSNEPELLLVQSQGQKISKRWMPKESHLNIRGGPITVMNHQEQLTNRSGNGLRFPMLNSIGRDQSSKEVQVLEKIQQPEHYNKQQTTTNQNSTEQSHILSTTSETGVVLHSAVPPQSQTTGFQSQPDANVVTSKKVPPDLNLDEHPELGLMNVDEGARIGELQQMEEAGSSMVCEDEGEKMVVQMEEA